MQCGYQISSNKNVVIGKTQLLGANCRAFIKAERNVGPQFHSR